MPRVFELLRRFRKDENGAFMVLFGVLALVLIAMSGAVVDFTYMQTARSRAQTALDAAALALQSKINDANAESTITTEAEAILRERLADSSISSTITHVGINTDAGTLNLQGQIVVPTAFVQLVGIKTITAHLESEATQGSTNLEVSVALDTTGSMGGSKISDLIDATDTLIDLVVKDTQPPTAPTYTKMALVPYSAGVNAGSYAAAARGPINGTAQITNVDWRVGSSVTIKSASKAYSSVITTATAHGLTDGDVIYITGAKGLTSINGGPYTVDVTSPTTFTIPVNSRYSYYSYTTDSGSYTKCATADCELVVTTASDPYLASGDSVYITGVSGMYGVNNSLSNPSTVGAVNGNSYVLSDSFGPSAGTYGGGGTSYCLKYSCNYFRFQSASGGYWGGSNYNTFTASTCVSERTGTHKYDDTSPATAPVSFNYPASGNPCLGAKILPLTTDKPALHALADSLTASGSTAGHLGLAWGWYLISPTFAAGLTGLPANSRPAAYKANNLIKAEVLMTDGFFNTPYCSGVIASNAGDGSGSSSDHINCSAPNGSSLDQASDLCDAIKDDTGIILYTVGFDIGSNSQEDIDARQFLSDCASDPSHFFQADTGSDLKDAFKAIAQNLSELRLSR